MKNQAGIEYILFLIARGESVLRQIEESGRAPNNNKMRTPLVIKRSRGISWSVEQLFT